MSQGTCTAGPRRGLETFKRTDAPPEIIRYDRAHVFFDYQRPGHYHTKSITGRSLPLQGCTVFSSIWPLASSFPSTPYYLPVDDSATKPTHTRDFLNSMLFQYLRFFLFLSPELWCMKTSDPSAHRSCTRPLHPHQRADSERTHPTTRATLQGGIVHIWSTEEPTDWWMIISKWCSMATRKRSRAPSPIFDRVSGKCIQMTARPPEKFGGRNILQVTRCFSDLFIFVFFLLFFVRRQPFYPGRIGADVYRNTGHRFFG